MTANHRVFFAVDLSPQIKTELLNYQQQIANYACQLIAAENFHITLSFLGMIPERKIEQIIDQLLPPSSEPFEIEISAPIYLSKGKILGLSISDGCKALSSLKNHIEQSLRTMAHFDLEKRDYQPHVSLVRNVEEPIDHLPAFSKNYSVDSFSLMESVQTRNSVRYETIEEWRLKPVKSIKEQLLGA